MTQSRRGTESHHADTNREPPVYQTEQAPERVAIAGGEIDPGLRERVIFWLVKTELFSTEPPEYPHQAVSIETEALDDDELPPWFADLAYEAHVFRNHPSEAAARHFLQDYARRYRISEAFAAALKPPEEGDGMIGRKIAGSMVHEQLHQKVEFEMISADGINVVLKPILLAPASSLPTWFPLFAKEIRLYFVKSEDQVAEKMRTLADRLSDLSGNSLEKKIGEAMAQVFSENAAPLEIPDQTIDYVDSAQIHADLSSKVTFFIVDTAKGPVIEIRLLGSENDLPPWFGGLRRYIKRTRIHHVPSFLQTLQEQAESLETDTKKRTVRPRNPVWKRIKRAVLRSAK